jgi:tRNA-dihydrouridine synthase A
VQNGRFGACLMQEPVLVGECVAAMKAAVSLPVTVKCRIGVDDQDPEEALDRLTDAVAAAGCDELTVHARKAWLQGLSPKENRDIPPLDYGRVYRLKQARAGFPIAINGGIRTMAEVHGHLKHVDGVMLGRVAYQEPEILLAVEGELHGEAAPVADGFEAIEAYEPYVAARLAEGERLHSMTRHMLGLFTGRPGARAYRRHLATEAIKPGANLQTLRDAMAHVSRLAAPSTGIALSASA